MISPLQMVMEKVVSLEEQFQDLIHASKVSDTPFLICSLLDRLPQSPNFLLFHCIFLHSSALFCFVFRFKSNQIFSALTHTSKTPSIYPAPVCF